MTNFEKYKDDLMKIEGSFAFDKNTREIVGCDTSDGVERCIVCEDCLFHEGDCFESDKIKWLYSEYKEPILSNDELELIKVLSKINGKEYKYIAKYRNHIYLFSNKPPMDKYGILFTSICDYLNINIYNESMDLFSNIKFEYGLYDIKNKCFIKV